jgi:hypothetical protein
MRGCTRITVFPESESRPGDGRRLCIESWRVRPKEKDGRGGWEEGERERERERERVTRSGGGGSE